MDWRWERWLPLTGVLAVGLWVIGSAIRLSAPTEESPEGALAAFEEHELAILLGGLILQIGTLLFIWFLGTLWARLRWAEGGLGRLATIAFGAGLATAVFLLALPAGEMAGVWTNVDVDASTAQTLTTLDDVFFLCAELSAAAFVAAVGLVTILTGVLPRWVGWVSLALALVLVILPIGWAGLLLGFPLWVLLVSFFLWQAGTTISATERTAPPPQAAA